jgi:hypothetical protein
VYKRPHVLSTKDEAKSSFLGSSLEKWLSKRGQKRHVRKCWLEERVKVKNKSMGS